MAALFSRPGRVRPTVVSERPEVQEASLEPFLEMLSWTLMLLVVVATLLGERVIPRLEGNLFVLAVVIYNTLIPWLLRNQIPLRWRTWTHMFFYPLAIGILLVDAGHMFPIYFSVLMFLPMGAASALGRADTGSGGARILGHLNGETLVGVSQMANQLERLLMNAIETQVRDEANRPTFSWTDGLSQMSLGIWATGSGPREEPYLCLGEPREEMSAMTGNGGTVYLDAFEVTGLHSGTGHTTRFDLRRKDGGGDYFVWVAGNWRPES